MNCKIYFQLNSLFNYARSPYFMTLLTERNIYFKFNSSLDKNLDFATCVINEFPECLYSARSSIGWPRDIYWCAKSWVRNFYPPPNSSFEWNIRMVKIRNVQWKTPPTKDVLTFMFHNWPFSFPLPLLGPLGLSKTIKRWHSSLYRIWKKWNFWWFFGYFTLYLFL